MDPRKPIFDAIRAGMGVLDSDDVIVIDAALDHIGFPGVPEALPSIAIASLTPRIFSEIVSHEAIVQEFYFDSEGIGTWGVGVTNASGHNVDRYKDNPQPIRKCLEVFAWLLREKYLPDVLKAFSGISLGEAQLAAALSFHYNTGAILRADWVTSFRAGAISQARAQFMNWRKPASIIGRREKERDLFFDNKWSGSGKATLWPVKKPSYRPDWSRGSLIDITSELQGVAL